MAFVHPFDDPDVVAGPGHARARAARGRRRPRDGRRAGRRRRAGVSGVAIAVKSARPDVEVVGVQVETVARRSRRRWRRARPVAVDAALTIADGIAVKRPGRPHAGAHRAHWVDDVVVVGEDDVAEAMVAAAREGQARRRGRGRGRRRRAAGRRGRAAPRGTTVRGPSGGNVDAGLLATVARRHETQAGRRLVLFTRVPDRPGALAAAARPRRRGGREPRRGRARPRGRRPPRPRDRGAARARDPRARARPAGARGAHAGGVRRAGRAVARSTGSPAALQA